MSATLDLANPKASPPAVPQKSNTELFTDLVRSRLSGVLVGKKADDFVTALISLMNQDVALKKCQPMSLVSAALQAQSLNLSLNKALGQAWIVPFNDNKNKVPDPATGEMVARVMATFQIGYKGYIQLAIRSGYYKKINVLAIKEGELRSYDPLNENIEVVLIQDVMTRHNTPSTGYYVMFEYLNGFQKCMYWPKELMLIHADTYSPAFSLKETTVRTKSGPRKKVSYEDYVAGRFDERDTWMFSSFWYKDFDAMAYKTMLRQILTKWGIMSVEMQQAYEADSRVMQENGDMGDYIDGEFTEVPQGEEAAPNPDPKAEGQEKPSGRASNKKSQDKTAPQPEPEQPAASLMINCPKKDEDVSRDRECQKCDKRETNCIHWGTEK